MTGVRFGIVGVEHPHATSLTTGLVEAGGHCVGYWQDSPGSALRGFTARYPDVSAARDPRELHDDPSVRLIVTAGVPADRAAVAVEAMRAGKDVLAAKPGCVTLDQLAQIEATVRETGRIWSVAFSERFSVRATVRAGELIRDGRIGTVVQTVGFGPHRLDLPSRPDWFFDPARAGGILTDIASHQIDQFLHFTGSATVEIAASTVANHAHPDLPGFADFGEVLLRGDRGHGYARVDWYTPHGLPTWGDGRLIILGTEGYLELRKYVDIAGRPGSDHLFLVDGARVERVDCSTVDLPYYRDLLRDILDRTERAMAQQHAFTVTRLAIEADRAATRDGHLASAGA